MIYLTYIDSPHLIWPAVEESLKRVKAKTRERWSLPFVFSRLQSKEAGLFRFHEDGKHLAYCVLEVCDQGDGRWLNVWILEGEGLEYAREAISLLDELCMAIGAGAWRCTGRKGWKAIGLKPVATVYEREVI